MKNFLLLSILGIIRLWGCFAAEPEMPNTGTLPFMVYFESRYRGLCVGTLVSRMVALTAAVCVVSLDSTVTDTRPINVVTGTPYRNAMRGIKVQVTKILIPKLPIDIGTRSYLIQKSAALLLLNRQVPDILTDEPLRAISVDIDGDETLTLQDECILMGWHFFYLGDKIYPVKTFILQRNLRYQIMNIVNKEMYCDTLVLKYEKATDDLGHEGTFMKDDVICLRDPDNTAQPCHGMYGAPMVCAGGRVVGMFMAPDAQWSNCTGYSVLVHRLDNRRNKNFFQCVKPLFEPEYRINWNQLKRDKFAKFDAEEEVIKSIYDGLISDFSSSTELELF